jgi:hypothetical protein
MICEIELEKEFPKGIFADNAGMRQWEIVQHASSHLYKTI